MSDYYKIIRLTAPATEPVTLAEAKAQLRIESGFTDEDTYITTLISVARDKLEQYCNRFFADCTAAILYRGFPEDDRPLYIPVPDVDSIDGLTYIDEDNATQSVDVGTLTFSSGYNFLWPTDNWPVTDAQGVRVEVTAGPPVEIVAAKHAILLMIIDLYDYRGNLTEVQVYDNKAAMMLMQPYRVEIGI